MQKKIISYMREKQMIEKGDRVVLGVSGGADSVCLLLFLVEMQRLYQLELAVVHVEHGIRGTESLMDAAFVQRLCEEYEVPFYMYQYPVATYAKEQHMTVEEAGRCLRYESFYAQAEAFMKQDATRPVKIAIAHNANDNAETMLFHLARGTGIDGLCGIPAVRKVERNGCEYTIIRPLLCVSRSQIEEDLHRRRQDYRVDMTNESIEYDRNKIRHEILPVLRQINEQALNHITQVTGELEDIASYVEKEGMQIYQKVLIDAHTLNRQLLRAYPTVMIKQVLHLWISQNANHGKDITARHIEAALDLVYGQVGRKIDLPYQLEIYADYEAIILRKKEDTLEEPCALEAAPGVCDSTPSQEKDAITITNVQWQELEAGKTLEIKFGKCQLFISIEDGKMPETIPEKMYTKWFDYDKIKDNLVIRHRHSGDYMVIDADGQKKKFKDYCINEKIPKEQRDELVLLCQKQHVIWAVGYRISEQYKVENTTKKMLKVHVVEEKNNE